MFNYSATIYCGSEKKEREGFCLQDNLFIHCIGGIEREREKSNLHTMHYTHFVGNSEAARNFHLSAATR